MKNMRQSYKVLVQDLGESFKGISKAAIAAAFYLETLLLVMAIVISLLCIMKVETNDVMTEHALSLYRQSLDQTEQYKFERDQYKQLYDDALEELAKLKKVHQEPE
mgnify:CR=1 FL=1